MLRSSSFVVLALFFLQVAFVLAIEPGTYFIQDFEGRFLGVGPVPRSTTPPDVPVRLFKSIHPFADRWEVKAQDGEVVISTRNPSGQFNLIAGHGLVLASAEKTPELWSVNSAGGGRQVIKLPYNDEVFTSVPGPVPALVRLLPSEGQEEQLWTFIRIESESNYHRGPTNRFCLQ
ncbi:hypothetical protein BG003_002435 [Podila horticola]|nr:hypothetical protein BG003_002435 [Podila horticola]